MRRQGFTLVEVMVSLGVMTIGAMALLAMQGQITRANIRARDVTIATQIAQNVIERVKLDALAWNNVTVTPATDLANAPLLLPIVSGTRGAFQTLPVRSSTLGGTTRVLSNAFDFAGDDVSLVDPSEAVLAQVRYCASYRLSWVYANFRAMRVDVRVWWAKEASGRVLLTDFASCADNGVDLDPGGTFFNDYHVVYLSTVIRPS